MSLKPLKPGVALTFDDYPNIVDWVKVKHLFKKHQAHATFFINAPDRMTRAQWNGLHELVSDGHAVGCHGLRHEKAIDYCQTHGAEEWLHREILPALEILKGQGIEVTSFGYPCSQSSNHTNDSIKPYFNHARTGAFLMEGGRLVELDPIFTPMVKVDETFLLPGKSIDNFTDLTEIEAVAERVVDRRELLVLYGHRIGTFEDGKNNTHLTHCDVLSEILDIFSSNGLQFYTFNQL
jgi:hypothetical protein